MEENIFVVEYGIKSEMVELFFFGLKNFFMEYNFEVFEEKFNVFDGMVEEFDEMEVKFNE